MIDASDDVRLISFFRFLLFESLIDFREMVLNLDQMAIIIMVDLFLDQILMQTTSLAVVKSDPITNSFFVHLFVYGVCVCVY